MSPAVIATWFRQEGVLPLDVTRFERGRRWAQEQVALREVDPSLAHTGGNPLPAELREAAGLMRDQGLDRSDVARELGVSPSTVSRWFREYGVEAGPRGRPGSRGRTASYRAAVRERWAHEDAEQARWADDVGPVSDRELLLVGAALYWAEGTKSKPWRRAHRVTFANSDPDVIRCFIAFLELLGTSREAIARRLQIHQTADAAEAQEWWRRELGADLRFHRPTLKRHVPTTVRFNTGEDYHGCLAVTVRDGARTYRRIVGTWQGVGRCFGVRLP